MRVESTGFGCRRLRTTSRERLRPARPHSSRPTRRSCPPTSPAPTGTPRPNDWCVFGGGFGCERVRMRAGPDARGSGCERVRMRAGSDAGGSGCGLVRMRADAQTMPAWPRCEAHAAVVAHVETAASLNGRCPTAALPGHGRRHCPRIQHRGARLCARAGRRRRLSMARVPAIPRTSSPTLP